MIIIEENFLSALGKNYITALHKDTFQDLVNLKNIYLFSNHLEVIEEELFKHNLKLESIGLKFNRIVFISPVLFEKLVNLISVDLVNNPCIDFIFLNNTSMISKEIKKCNNNNTNDRQQTAPTNVWIFHFIVIILTLFSVAVLIVYIKKMRQFKKTIMNYRVREQFKAQNDNRPSFSMESTNF